MRAFVIVISWMNICIKNDNTQSIRMFRTFDRLDFSAHYYVHLFHSLGITEEK